MKPSPIQLLQVLFKHVRVDLDPGRVPDELPNPLTAVYTFDDVCIQTEFGIAEADPDHERGRMFFMGLRVLIDNKPQAEATDQKYSPYLIDVAVEGLVVVLKGAEKLGPPEDLASVNGAAVLWSAVREQVLALTSRMRAGPVMLPTVHFHDLKCSGSVAKDQTASQDNKPAPAKRALSKSK